MHLIVFLLYMVISFFIKEIFNMIFIDFESLSKDPNSKSTIWKRNKMQKQMTMNKKIRSIDESSGNELFLNEVLSVKMT